jgi:hypothetical protein
MDAFTKAMADYEDYPVGQRQRLIKRRWADFERTVQRRLTQVREEYKNLLGEPAQRRNRWEASLRRMLREAHIRDKGFMPFWLAVNELIGRPGEYTRTLTKVDLRPGEFEPACFEATLENIKWLAERCDITARWVRSRLEQGEALGMVDVMPRAGKVWHDQAKIYKLADRKVRVVKQPDGSQEEIPYKDYLLWQRKDLIIAALK